MLNNCITYQLRPTKEMNKMKNSFHLPYFSRPQNSLAEQTTIMLSIERTEDNAKLQLLAREEKQVYYETESKSLSSFMLGEKI